MAAADGTPVLVAMLSFDVEVEFSTSSSSSNCQAPSKEVDPCILENIFNSYFDDQFLLEFESRVDSTTNEPLYSPFRRVVINYDDPNGSIDCDRRRLLLHNNNHHHFWLTQQQPQQQQQQQQLLQRRRDQTQSCVVVHSYGGFSIFTKAGGKPVPNTNIVAAIQLQAFEDTDGTLLRTVQTNFDPTPSILSVTLSVSSNENPTPSPPSNNNSDASAAGAGGAGGVDTVILVAIVVAALSMLLLAIALFLAFRRKQKDTYFSTPTATMSSSGSPRSPNDLISPKTGATTMEPSTPLSAATAAGGGTGDTLDGFQNDESPYSVSRGAGDTSSATANSGLYPESVISADIASSLNAYEKQFKGRTDTSASAATTNASSQQSKTRKTNTADAAAGGGGDSTVNEGVDDSRSESSMASSAYGYSLDGYASSIAQSTQYGY